MRNLFHPTRFRLDRFVDGDLPKRAHARVKGHLEGCPRCRAHVRSTREIGRRIRGLSALAPDDAALERIMATLASGALVPLPVEGPIRLDPPRSRRRAIGVTTAAALVAGAALVFTVPGLDARHGALSFSNGPRAGEPLHVTYRRGPLPAGEGALRARVRIHGPDGEVEVTAVTVAPRRWGRGYEGRLALPEWAVYAAFAVEDTSGAHVDSNHGRLWEVLAHDDEGRPLFEALRVRAAQRAPTDLDAALESARSMVEHHPARVEGWGTLFALERMQADRQELDSLTALHEERFRDLDRRLADAHLRPDEIAAMVLYAHSVGKMTAAESWTDRLFRDAPRTRAAVQLRLQELERDHGHESARLLAQHERLWEDVGPRVDIAAAAFAVAQRSGDGAAALGWADRWVRLEPAARVPLATRLSTIPDARRDGIRRLRSELRRIEEGLDAEERPLERSVPEHRASQERTRRRVLTSLGNALLAEGDRAAGTDALLDAAELGWNPEVFRAAADAFTTNGDTATALTLLARVAADPATDAGERQELAALGKRHLTPWEWEDQVNQARTRMRRQVLAEAVRRPLPRRVAAEDEESRAADLVAMLNGDVAVVSLWHCLCPVFAAALARHRSLLDELADAGVPLVTVVTGRTPAAAANADEALAQGLDVLADPDGQVLEAFGHARTPAYFVVDADGYVRFRYSSADEVLRQALVLHDETPPALGRE